MSDTDDHTPIAPDLKPSLWDWRRRARWFGVEFLVVVTGVLVALALSAWWGHRQDAAMERVYLRELSTDLWRTESRITSSDACRYNVDYPSASRLVHSFGLSPKPPADSVFTWFMNAWRLNTDRPVLGTVKALVATGHLSLIRDNSLRFAILAYLDLNENLVEEQAVQYQITNEAGYSIAEQLDIAEAFALVLPDSVREGLSSDWIVDGLIPTGEWSAPFPLDVEAFYADRALYSHVITLASGLQNDALIRTRMLESAQTLREWVADALDE